MAPYSRKRKYGGAYSSSVKRGRFGGRRRGRFRRRSSFKRRVFRRFGRKRRSTCRKLKFRRRFRRRNRGLVHYVNIKCAYEFDLVMKYDSVYPIGKTFKLSCNKGRLWFPLNDQAQVLNAAKFNMFRHKRLLRASFSYTNSRMYMETLVGHRDPPVDPNSKDG